MNGKLPLFHFVSGFGGVIVFFLSGIWMKLMFPDAYNESESIRYLYRANHIYILFSSVTNIFAGMFLSANTGRRQSSILSFGTLFLAASLPVLIAAFFLEPPAPSPMRYWTLTGIFSLAIGTVLHVFCFYRNNNPKAL